MVFEQPFQLEWAGVTSQPSNIIAFINASEVGAGTILIGAHYDSISVDFEDGTAFAPGANDDGSGIAALLEIARVLSTREHRSSIMFVAFSAEEVRRQGSQAFVNDYLLPRSIDISAMIALDIIGSPMDANGAIDDHSMRVYSAGPNDLPSRQVARELELIVLNHVPSMSLNMVDAVDREGRYSDHISFNEAGYPAVRLIESLEDLSRQHNERDTIDGVQPAYLTKTTQTILTIVTALADGLPPPRNIALRDAGNGARTLIWEPILARPATWWRFVGRICCAMTSSSRYPPPIPA